MSKNEPSAQGQLEQLVRYLAVERDIADRVHWARSCALAGTSQEMQLSLHGILANARLVQAEGGLSAVQGRRVEAMLERGEDLQRTITTLFDLSEAGSEPVELRMAAIDLLTVATACIDLIRPAAEAKNLTLNLVVPSSLRLTAKADPVRLRQILLNLLGNAVKFTSQGSVELRLRTVADGAMLRISVTDTGPGLPAKERRRLFRDLDRPDLEAVGNVSAEGFGLALTARLVSLMGGSLGHHDKPGGGSVFWLELPLNGEPSPAAVTDAPVQPAPAIRSSAGIRTWPTADALHVLVVDDADMDRDIAGSFLRTAGHRVTCAESGPEAVEAVHASDFNVVLMDLRMPGMDGLEATRRIRALGGERRRWPVLALTARSSPEQISLCRDAGMDGHLAKPFDPDTLLAGVLRAHALGRTHGGSFDLGLMPAPAADVVTGSRLPVCDLATFDRTARHLTPEAVASYLHAIAERGEALLHRLRRPDALLHAGHELAETAQAMAVSAGMFGFERLTALAHRFESAAHAATTEASAIAETLSAALEVTLHMIHDRARTSLET